MLIRFLDWFEEHKTGVIGTLALHTVVLFAFTLLYLRTSPTEEEVSDMRIDVVPPEEAEAIEQRIAAEQEGAPEKVTNLTSNITAELKPAFNQQRLADRVEEELRALEQSEKDRLEQERLDRGEKDPVIPELDPSKWNKELYLEKAAEPVRVEGATTVWHDLKDRVRGLGVPGYKCKDQGRVAVRVAVDRSGAVRKAEVDEAQSYHADECMIEQALTSAKQTRFNASASAPEPQSGTVYFRFVPQ